MSDISCQQVDRGLWRYIDRELPAGELARISTHLRGCEACRSLYHSRSSEASRCRVAFLDAPFGESFVRQTLAACRSEGLLGEREPTRAGGLFLPVAEPAHVRMWHSIRRWSMVAAIALIVPSMLLVTLFSPGPAGEKLGTFEVAQGAPAVTWHREAAGRRRLSKELSQTAGICVAGAAYEVAPEGSLTLALPLSEGRKTELACSGDTAFRIGPHATSQIFIGHLAAGKLRAKVAPQRASESFTIETPHAYVRVIGTEFDLEVAARGTRLVVLKGTVEFRAKESLPGRGVELVTAERGPFFVGEGAAEPFGERLEASLETSPVGAPAAAERPEAVGSLPEPASPAPVQLPPGPGAGTTFKEPLDTPVEGRAAPRS